MAMAFISAVRHRFAGGWSVGDVILFVSQVRARAGGYGNLSPSLAEQLILSVLRDAPFPGWSAGTATAYAQFVLLKELVSDCGDQLTALLAGARHDADRWIAARTGP